ncbi:L-fucokinase/GDP-L-fucose pyrophosphorylase [Artemisia annua]|uniref:L-fucokinase/GDP-L-fucose pyrophosphorylase n=1 Tax=Artemisia annua TaxID=35608 RepID=A0A2U1NSI7_ARTAN|nr:L-fucokinase/GDP-L-fucose pyrophosphorylase [Artemisia annua]
MNQKSSNSTNLEEILRKSWYRLRLSVRSPRRVPTWDAIVLTAASPEQAALYEWQLKKALRMGRIADSTVTLAVPDPHGKRIGSVCGISSTITYKNSEVQFGYWSMGEKRLIVAPRYSYPSYIGILADVIMKLFHVYVFDCSCREKCVFKLACAFVNYVSFSAMFSSTFGVVNGCSESSSENEVSTSMINFLKKKHVLLLHAGGDSKRVPWANPMGKVFLPLPYLAADDPDGPVPLLFDHILAISSCARQAYNNQGGLFIMTGDVLPCFDASAMVLPEDTSCIITVPITLDIASNHGVIVASKTGNSDEVCSVSPVANLLQKPSVEELSKHHAILDDGRALLDTGIIAVRGKAWEDLVTLSCLSQPMISELLNTKKEARIELLIMSLYEDLVAAWVPAKHDWLRSRPLGEELVRSLGKQTMYSYCAYDLLFLHFGTSSEVLDHLSGTGSRIVGRRHLCSIPATTMSDIAASAVIVSSKISPGVSIGEDSLVYDSSISDGIQIGSLSIAVGVTIPEKDHEATNDPYTFLLPDRHCLWEVPLTGCTERVIVYCGLHDNPKNPVSKDGTFCGKPWEKVLEDLGILENDLWSTQEKCLWNAKLFPVLPYHAMLRLANWLMGLENHDKNLGHGNLWKMSRRVSLEELHRSIDFPQMCLISSNHQADLAAKIARACLTYGLLGRNLSQLCQEILQLEDSGEKICADYLALCPSLQTQNGKIVPKSRAYQVQADLLHACSNHEEAIKVEHQVWAAVADETASAVRYGFKEHLFQSSSHIAVKEHGKNNVGDHVNQTFQHRKVKVELPVRVDFVGGWSDTPPWSLERAGCVLNMAITLDSSLPIGTVIETTQTPGVYISDDASDGLYISDLSSITTPFDKNDQFRLVKSALLVTGIVHDKTLISTGLLVKTWAHIPRGSGLGTSSILAAAVVKGLLRITDGDESNENVARLVLVLEQMMGTGGGWQDQIGGLYPGIKFTTSFPGIPLRLQVMSLLASPRLVTELQERLLVVFTGQVRLAHQVLQKVVTRYLQRDNLLISSIKRLAELAKTGREALMNCNIDELGDIMMETWRLHQELDPHCSNEFVDSLFAFADRYCCGYKLVGAGGGGFALLLAKNAENALQLRHALEESSDFDVKVYNWNVCLEN